MTKSDVVRRNLAHIGIILCHISILGFVVMLSGILSVVFTGMILLLGFMLIIITIGTIFAIIPNYWGKLMAMTEGTGAFFEIFSKALPVVGIVSVVCCVASVVLTALDLKWDKAKPRLIISSINLGVLILLFVAIAVGIVRSGA